MKGGPMTPSRSTRTFKSSERGLTLIEYLVFVIILSVLAVVAVLSIKEISKKNSQSSKKPTATSKMEVETVTPAKTIVVEVPYRGRVLYCEHYLVETRDGFGVIEGEFCDKDRFYDENPDLVKTKSKDERGS